MRDGKLVFKWQELENSATYVLAGGLFRSRSQSQQRQVDDRVLEGEVALAITRDLGDSAHYYPNVKYLRSSKDKPDFDAIIIHTDGSDGNEPSALVVECAYCPQLHMVDKLLSKAEMFKSIKTQFPYFSDVTSENVMTILGGTQWSQEVVDKCKQNKVGRVEPRKGFGFRVIRPFCSIALKFIK